MGDAAWLGSDFAGADFGALLFCVDAGGVGGGAVPAAGHGSPWIGADAQG